MLIESLISEFKMSLIELGRNDSCFDPMVNITTELYFMAISLI